LQWILGINGIINLQRRTNLVYIGNHPQIFSLVLKINIQKNIKPDEEDYKDDEENCLAFGEITHFYLELRTMNQEPS